MWMRVLPFIVANVSRPAPPVLAFHAGTADTRMTSPTAAGKVMSLPVTSVHVGVLDVLAGKVTVVPADAREYRATAAPPPPAGTAAGSQSVPFQIIASPTTAPL